MKKIVAVILSLSFILVMAGCGSNPDNAYDIKIIVPAGSSEEFVYSDEEISPTKNKITISSGKGSGDMEVVLKPAEAKEQSSCGPAYLTPGMPVEMDMEKGDWYKVGVNVQNPTGEDIVVYINIKDIEVRIQ